MILASLRLGRVLLRLMAQVVWPETKWTLRSLLPSSLAKAELAGVGDAPLSGEVLACGLPHMSGVSIRVQSECISSVAWISLVPVRGVTAGES